MLGFNFINFTKLVDFSSQGCYSDRLLKLDQTLMKTVFSDFFFLFSFFFPPRAFHWPHFQLTTGFLGHIRRKKLLKSQILSDAVLLEGFQDTFSAPCHCSCVLFTSTYSLNISTVTSREHPQSLYHTGSKFANICHDKPLVKVCGSKFPRL